MGWTEEIDALYKDYAENVRQYYFLLAAIGGGAQPALSNELRAVFDHVSRCYTAKDEEKRSEECRSARAHLLRFKLDVFKTHLLLGAKRYEELTEAYCGVPVESIGNMRFFSAILPAFSKSKEKHREARKEEGDDKEKALQDYKEATDALVEIDRCLEEFSNEMKESKKAYKKRKRKVLIISLLAPFVSIVIELILEYCLT